MILERGLINDLLQIPVDLNGCFHTQKCMNIIVDIFGQVLDDKLVEKLTIKIIESVNGNGECFRHLEGFRLENLVCFIKLILKLYRLTFNCFSLVF